ncbi:ras association family member [Oratosquilla oratoria]|uniref:ras association family member n=1 Tax=Oratosquilla oratoria TaxID=337810 RepID=UPI003F757FF3
MWQCRKCGKPVFFAERKQSLGFDWHPKCLRCEECGKRLNPGQHAEHKGVPYCHHPCYGALFGPQLFGHGTRNECHTSFGKVENRDGQVKRSHLEVKLKTYNQHCEGKPVELKSREANGRIILEGVLRIYWGVRSTIHLKEEDDQRTITTFRRSLIPKDYSDSDSEENFMWRDDSPNCSPSISRGISPQTSCVQSPEDTQNTPSSPSTSSDGTLINCKSTLLDHMTEQDSIEAIDNAKNSLCNSNEILSDPNGKPAEGTLTSTRTSRTPTKSGSTAIRRRPGRRMDKSKLKRRCSINGHFYLRETSVFTPPYGCPCTIWVTSLVTANEVLNMFLEKYKVEMSASNFALFVLKDNGECRRIREDEYPLITRVMLGPHEEVAKFFIMDAQYTQEVSPQVAQFLNLSLAECRAILLQYHREEQRQLESLKKKYDDMKLYIEYRMKQLRA